MTTAFSLFKANDPYENLISNMILMERQPQTLLKTEKTEQERLKAVLGDVDSKLSALNSIVSSLTDLISSPFAATRASVPSSGNFSVSTTDSAAFGSHTLQVERLARSDTRISAQFGSTATTLRSFFDTNGAQTFDISVAKPTEADPTNRIIISVEVNPTGTTDSEVLREISAAINDAMTAAVEAGVIDSKSRSFASVVNETSSTSRLSLRSGQTGYDFRLEFSDSAAGLLSALDLTRNEAASGGSGGQVTLVGTSELDSGLNSKFILDGLTLYRNTNHVSDALDGSTLSLTRVTSEDEEFSIGSNTESIRAEIEKFIQRYNDVLTFIAQKSAIDGESGVRGDFANDATFRDLRYGMRNIMAASVPGLPSGAPSMLSAIGITINKDGTLELTDPDKLSGAVVNDASAVKTLFAGPNGFGSQLKSRVGEFLGVSGLINTRDKLMDERIRRITGRIDNWEERLKRREEQLRTEFARVQEAMAAFQGQQQSLMGFGYF